MNAILVIAGIMALGAVTLAALLFGGMCGAIGEAVKDAKKDRDSADWWKNCDP